LPTSKPGLSAGALDRNGLYQPPPGFAAPGNRVRYAPNTGDYSAGVGCLPGRHPLGRWRGIILSLGYQLVAPEALHSIADDTLISKAVAAGEGVLLPSQTLVDSSRYEPSSTYA
jgi:hypothetical protein